MSDLRLFRVGSDHVEALSVKSMAVEKSLQELIENNLDTLLGVRFLASEFSTGKEHGGRMDTLGIDENGCPVIVEYKRALNENVINQGLFYLDWLMNHRADFTLLVMKVLGNDVLDQVDWSAPRLICIAGDFTKYDEYAVKQINRNIELIRYRRYDTDLLLFELVNATSATTPIAPILLEEKVESTPTTTQYKSAEEMIEDLRPDGRQLFDELSDRLNNLGDDVQMKVLKLYVAFKRIRNFVCVEIRPKEPKFLLFLRLDPANMPMEEGFSRDVREIGHWGTGDVEITIRNAKDIERAWPHIITAYEGE